MVLQHVTTLFSELEVMQRLEIQFSQGYNFIANQKA